MGTRQPTPDNPGQLDELPLKRVRYRATITGLQSEVVVEQDYENRLKNPVEAVYVFPLPAEANIRALEMRIGNRRIIADLRKREEARQAYEDARDAGHSAALLEQERENIFTMNVGGIQPGEQVSVSVTTIAPVDWQDGGGRYTAPLVVAPRFIPGSPIGKQGTGWADDTDKSPDASRITPQVVEEVSYTASIAVKLDPGFAAHVECPSHPDMISPFDLEEGKTRMIELVGLRADRDFILTYRTQATLPTAKVDRVNFAPKDGGPLEEFVLLQLTPGAVSAEVRTPLDAILVLDKSGSMNGGPIAGLKRVANKVLQRFESFGRPVRIGLVTYDSSIRAQHPLAPIKEAQAHRQAISDLTADGCTQTPLALDAAMKMFGDESDGRERCIVLITDAMVDTKYKSKRGVRIHVVGIGTAVNDELAKRWSRETGGSTYFTRPDEDLDGAATAIAALASGPVVIDLAIRDLPEKADVVGVDDLYAGRPRTVAIRLPRPITEFTVFGKGADGQPIKWLAKVPTSESTTELAALIWAKAKIRATDEDGDKTRLSLRYGIICATTAFVAVSLRETPGEKPQRIDIPVNLPEGWNMGAVFGNGVPCGGGAHIHRLGGAPRFRGGATLGGSARRVVTNPKHGGGDSAALPTPVSTAHELLDKAIAALLKARNGSLEDAEWQTLTATLSSEEANFFSGWGEEDKAQLFATLVELGKFGYKVAISQTISAEPKDAGARVRWAAARKLQGYAVTN